ncbi:ureidoglycolate lyase [Marinomonas sp. 2405UD68-3]|uniref:ureidoglycolate lyase n=1 Tax=Marinomonas sp. 2405UD68-3 TaxID=3391835 RepID=UPI0039C94F69
MHMQIDRLTPENFQFYGDVIDAQNAATHYLINKGTTTRFHDLAKVDIVSDDVNPANVGISIFRGDARVFPLRISMLERHPLGSQAFMPLNQKPYLIVVAPSLDEHRPDIHKMKVFWAKASQGVNYACGTWHHPLIALGDAADFLVIDRIGSGHNCDEYEFDEAFVYQIDETDFARFSS